VEISWQRTVVEVPAKRDEPDDAEEPAQTCNDDQQAPEAPASEVQNRRRAARRVFSLNK
jgi:hypothetical protein